MERIRPLDSDVEGFLFEYKPMAAITYHDGENGGQLTSQSARVVKVHRQRSDQGNQIEHFRLPIFGTVM